MDADDDFLCPKCKSPILFTLNQVPSPVPCIFHSNEPPTGLESKLIHETLNEADHQISTIDAEIAQIEAALEKLRSQKVALDNHRETLANHRETLDNHRAAHSTLLSPLRRLPPELLSEVFIHLSRSTPSSSPFCEGPTPWILSQVCRRWRNVALSTPALWTSLNLNYYRRHDPELAIEAVLTWLSSSGQLMLSLSMIFPTHTPASSVRRYFELIPDLSHRLRNLELRAPQSLLRTLFSTLRSLPRLELLRLSTYTDPDPDEANVVIVAPKLTTVSISRFSKFHLPWSQLTKLQTFDLDVTSCLSIIASSSSLQSYSFCSNAIDGTTLPSLLSTPIISNIRSLSLQSFPPEWAMYLLSNLTLPLLSEFKSTSGYMEEFRFRFKNLAERSHFPLGKLSVTCMTSDCRCYRVLSNLTSLSKLEELELCFGGATKEYLKDLFGRLMDASGPSHSIITHQQLSGEASLPDLPALRAFTLRYLSEEATSMLVDMVRSPWKVRYEYVTRHRTFITLRRP